MYIRLDVFADMLKSGREICFMPHARRELEGLLLPARQQVRGAQ